MTINQATFLDLVHTEIDHQITDRLHVSSATDVKNISRRRPNSDQLRDISKKVDPPRSRCCLDISNDREWTIILLFRDVAEKPC